MGIPEDKTDLIVGLSQWEDEFKSIIFGFLTEPDESIMDEIQYEDESEDESSDGNYSAEEVYENDLAGNLNQQQKKKGGSKYKVVVDTNVFEIKFSQLQDKEIVSVENGNFWKCIECSGLLNLHSEVNAVGSNLETWKCNFCGCKSNTHIGVSNRKPHSEQITIRLKASTEKREE